MTNERWLELMSNQAAELTEAEMLVGWHWCLEFDGLLVGPGMEEMEICGGCCGATRPDVSERSGGMIEFARIVCLTMVFLTVLVVVIAATAAIVAGVTVFFSPLIYQWLSWCESAGECVFGT